MPEHVVESAWLAHGPFAFWLVAALKPATFAELGTHNGFSYFVFCEAATRLHLDTRTFAIDTWAGDDHAGFYGDDIFDLVVRVNTERYTSRSTLLRGYFDDFAGKFEDGTIDLLHIDGRHGYDDARHDFESWLPKMSDRGVVLFHDIAEHDHGFGVWQLWDDVAARYPSFAFEHSHGLGVISVGPIIDPALQSLFDATVEETTLIREFYSARGQRVEAAYGLLREREQLRAAVVESDRRAFDSRKELAGVLNSIAWKSTVPLRWVTSKLPPALRLRMRGTGR
ncbi:MAG: class I SAM-dependent methyltransferase [Actinomycetota bacterium]